MEKLHAEHPDAEALLAAALIAAQKLGGAEGEDMSGCGLPLTAMPAARVVMMQAVLCEVVTVMNGNTAEV